MSSFKFRVLVVLFIWILRIGYMVKEDMKHLSPGSTNHNIWEGGGGGYLQAEQFFFFFYHIKYKYAEKKKILLQPFIIGRMPDIRAIPQWLGNGLRLHLKDYSRLSITRTLANSNLALTRTKIQMPKISIVGQIVSEILPQLCFDDSIQIPLTLTWV